jgi:hypothetical protein
MFAKIKSSKMSLKKYLILMSLSTLLCCGAWWLVVSMVDPATAGPIGFAIFYLALFFALAGIFALVGFVVRYLFKKDEFAFRQVKVAFRQAIMLALLLVASLMLQARGLLAWWNWLILIVLLTVLEFFFINQKQATDATDVGAGVSNL